MKISTNNLLLNVTNKLFITVIKNPPNVLVLSSLHAFFLILIGFVDNIVIIYKFY